MSMERIIAIIEDDNLLSLVLKKQLEIEGIPTRIFSKAIDFIDFLASDPKIILVLMDIKLKGIDLSHHPNQEQIRDILIKPVDIDQLMLRIKPLI